MSKIQLAKSQYNIASAITNSATECICPCGKCDDDHTEPCGIFRDEFLSHVEKAAEDNLGKFYSNCPGFAKAKEDKQFEIFAKKLYQEAGEAKKVKDMACRQRYSNCHHCQSHVRLHMQFISSNFVGYIIYNYHLFSFKRYD